MNELYFTGPVSKPGPNIYAKHISEYTSLKKEGKFSTCLTELQRDFLKWHPTKVKSLIRLVKHWYPRVRHPAQSLRAQEVGRK